MDYNDYVKHMYQKYRLAVAIAVLKEKPNDITIEQHIENLKEKLNHNSMDFDDSDLISLKDFNFDDDSMSITCDSTSDVSEKENSSSNFEENKNNQIEKVTNEKVAENYNTKVTSIARRSENSNSFTDILDTLTNIDGLDDSMEIEVENDFSQIMIPNQVLVDKVTKNINKATKPIEEANSKTTTNINNIKDMIQEVNNKNYNKKDVQAEKTQLIQLNNSQSQILITNNSKIQEKSATVLRNIRQDEVDKEILKHGREKNKFNEKTKNNNNNDDTELLDTQETIIYTVPRMDFTEISQSQSQIVTISNKYITGNRNKEVNNENIVFGSKLDNANVNFDPTHINLYEDEDCDDFAPENNVFGINSGQIEYIIDSSGQKYKVLQQYTATENVNIESRCLTTNNDTVPRNIQHFETMNIFGTEIVQYPQNVPYNIPGNKNGISLQNSEKSYQINERQIRNSSTITNLEDGTNIEKQITNEHRIKHDKNTENGTNTGTQSTNTDIGTSGTPTNTGTQSQEMFDEELDYRDEAVPFKIIKELSKVKAYLRGRERRPPSTDGFSSDSGYRSDSQSSYKNVHSDNWVHQSAFCLYNYIAESPIVSTDITDDISQVLGCLIDKLHSEEKYPTFLETLLDKVETLLQELYNGCGDSSILLEKDENIQRILLLNKSVHVQKFTLEKIVAILNEIHGALIKDIPNEITHTEPNENICYIFYTMEILLTKYIKNKNITTDLPTESQEKVLKKSLVADIWRKKWNPNFKEVVQKISQDSCVLKKCSEILNKIVVDCVESYSLVAFSALQCFNLLQK